MNITSSKNRRMAMQSISNVLHCLAEACLAIFALKVLMECRFIGNGELCRSLGNMLNRIYREEGIQCTSGRQNVQTLTI